MSNLNRAFGLFIAGSEWLLAAYFYDHGQSPAAALAIGAITGLIAIAPWKDKK